MAGIKVGDLFSSFEELETKIKTYSDTNYTQLWMRDAKTLAAAAKRVPKKVTAANAQLKLLK